MIPDLLMRTIRTIFVTAMVMALPMSITASSETYFDHLQQLLIKDGFNPVRIQKLYRNSDVNFDINGISLFFAHREARLNYDQFTSRKAIKRARRYMKTYGTDLARAEKTFGVGREIITAIILVETQLGTRVGKSPVLNSLSSMASLQDPSIRDRVWGQISNPIGLSKQEFDAWSARKSKWAYNELKSFLEYTGREDFDAADIIGSIAGALGIAQFMPSSIIAYAKDGDNDGRIDLFNHADAIASVASYLKHYGWKPGIDSKKAYKVVFRYNRSSYYVNTILTIEARLKG